MYCSADGFNLYGLRNQIPHMKQCLELILGPHSPDTDFYESELYPTAKKLYGLIHQRYILTAQGQRFMVRPFVCSGRQRMSSRQWQFSHLWSPPPPPPPHQLHKYEFGDFGTCPRVLCHLANVLPVRCSARVLLHSRLASVSCLALAVHAS